MCIIYVWYHSVSCTKVWKSSYSNSNCRKSNPNWIKKRPCETWLNYQPCSTNQLLHRSILLFAYPDPSFSGVAHITKIFSGATLQNLKKKKIQELHPPAPLPKPVDLLFGYLDTFQQKSFHWPGLSWTSWILDSHIDYHYIHEFLWDLRPDSGLRLSRQFFLFPDGSLKCPQQVTRSCWASTMGQRLLWNLEDA